MKLRILPILVVAWLKIIQLRSAPMMTTIRTAHTIQDIAEIAEMAKAAKGANSAVGTLRDVTELGKGIETATTAGVDSADLFKDIQTSSSLGLFIENPNLNKTDTFTSISRQKALKTQSTTAVQENSLVDKVSGAGNSEKFNPNTVEGTKTAEAVPKEGSPEINPSEVNKEVPKEAPNELGAASGEVTQVKDASLSKAELANGAAEEHGIIKPLSEYSASFIRQEELNQLMTNQMLLHISKYSTGALQEWAKTNEYVLEAIQWEKSETRLGHFLSKFIVPKWRAKFPGPLAPGEVRELTNGQKLSKGWMKLWKGQFGDQQGVRRGIENSLKFIAALPFYPLTFMGEIVGKVRGMYNVKFLNWLKLNAPDNIRATIPNFAMEGEKANPFLMPSEAITRSSTNPQTLETAQTIGHPAAASHTVTNTAASHPETGNLLEADMKVPPLKDFGNQIDSSHLAIIDQPQPIPLPSSGFEPPPSIGSSTHIESPSLNTASHADSEPALVNTGTETKSTPLEANTIGSSTHTESPSLNTASHADSEPALVNTGTETKSTPLEANLHTEPPPLEPAGRRPGGAQFIPERIRRFFSKYIPISPVNPGSTVEGWNKEHQVTSASHSGSST
ncbi:hypothetical protein PtA15_11A453 [Puccinia triticina]|uniref:Uncharacterized protein n=1 Tax=Puccinia triticina TaxID=208348 RepID=A0ABY7D0J3_9BASI|nr:uncharacterized protein PtA15_11A453 [Puccinia triticina]WAQ89762.1 hypothetical protein PtA15_11A453 [Puccinia triticina]